MPYKELSMKEDNNKKTIEEDQRKQAKQAFVIFWPNFQWQIGKSPDPTTKYCHALTS